ncbi:MAG: cupredoxin family protein [Proteobacteria bacterium]|nr:cupredoxin family protein [Pseudomonadota bacterium]
MKQLTRATCFALVLASSAVFGHGDEAHGAKTPHGASIGKPGELAKISRTIVVEMNDGMRFIPSAIAVKRGDTIRFLVKNSGRLKHEMVLGSIAELKEHAELMRRFPQMVHADPNQVAVDPGQTGELVWQFTNTGKVDFACLQPGHFEAGMKGKVAVK